MLKWFFQHIFLIFLSKRSWQWCDFSIFVKTIFYQNYIIMVSFFFAKIKKCLSKTTLLAWFFIVYFFTFSSNKIIVVRWFKHICRNYFMIKLPYYDGLFFCRYIKNYWNKNTILTSLFVAIFWNFQRKKSWE